MTKNRAEMNDWRNWFFETLRKRRYWKRYMFDRQRFLRSIFMLIELVFSSCSFDRRIYDVLRSQNKWMKAIFENAHLVELDVILYVIRNFYDAILYELMSIIVTQLKINAFINKSDKRASVKNTLQINIFIKIIFFV